MTHASESCLARCETLEGRTLLSGVTLVTHGFQPTDRAEAWVHEMASDVARRAGEDTALFRLRINGEGDDAKVASFRQIGGKRLGDASHSNQEVVIELDWAEASGVLLSYTETQEIAKLVRPYLVNKVKGVKAPLAQGSIHLIGHSRGGSVVASLAQSLGESGIWVDQLTLMDAFPVSDDAAVRVTRNVAFADNYFQTNAFPEGERPAGAYRVDLSDTDFGAHTEVHEYYAKTVRMEIRGGYDFSRVGGRNRPAGGVGKIYGGNAQRASVEKRGKQWPNVGAVQVTDRRLTVGDRVGLAFQFQDRDSPAGVRWFLDKDTNPSNGTAGALTNLRSLKGTRENVKGVAMRGKVGDVSAGNYFVMGRVKDADGNTRYVYAPKTVRVVM
jgi:pimeloyl-ACP methyl ester carboxylesterase